VLAQRDGEGPADSSKLKDVVMKVHATLRHLTTEGRKMSRRSQSLSETPPTTRVASNRQSEERLP
jgi:hypothetical protein